MPVSMLNGVLQVVESSIGNPPRRTPTPAPADVSRHRRGRLDQAVRIDSAGCGAHGAALSVEVPAGRRYWRRPPSGTKPEAGSPARPAGVATLLAPAGG